MSNRVRLMQQGDIAAVFDVQALAYVAEMVEPAELLAARLSHSPTCSWVAQEHGQVLAYLAAYPSMVGRISALGQQFQAAAQPNALYLHDMAVSPQSAGRGLAQALLGQAFDHAREQGWRYVCLVSVQSTRDFWQRQGFNEQAGLSCEQQEKLASYTGPAFYMIRDLDRQA